MNPPPIAANPGQVNRLQIAANPGQVNRLEIAANPGQVNRLEIAANPGQVNRLEIAANPGPCEGNFFITRVDVRTRAASQYVYMHLLAKILLFKYI